MRNQFLFYKGFFLSSLRIKETLKRGLRKEAKSAAGKAAKVASGSQ